MADVLRIGLAGLGVVGAGVVKVLEHNRAIIERRAGRPFEITAVSARDRNKDRGIDLSACHWVDNPAELADLKDVDVVVELMGGSEGPALDLARKAIANGKALVTANKAMIAHHGMILAAQAEAAGTALKYEAAVAGGIPVIKGLREGAAANEISQIYGILNGTCNYILTTMEAEGRDFDNVLSEAQALGYAEADPSFDIDGIDAAHKLAILTTLGFGVELNFSGVSATGIRNVLAQDIAQARNLGYRIRLVGKAAIVAGKVQQRVQPSLVPVSHPLAHVSGAMNAVVAEGNYVGRLFFEGRGAGEGPTASAVVADMIDIAKGEVGPAFAMPISALAKNESVAPDTLVGRRYVRLSVADQPGVLAEIAAAMRDCNVSIESLIQRGEAPDSGVLLALITHPCSETAIEAAITTLKGSPSLVGTPMVMPILEM